MSTTQRRKSSRAAAASKAGFEQAAAAVLGRLQSALRSLLDETPGVFRKPVELAHNLGIHGKLAWQAHRMAYADDPLVEASNLPGPTAMKRFLDAAARRGSPPERIAAVQDALRELRDFIRLHTANRSEFETMVSALTQSGSEQVDLVQKRAAFKAQSHILGVQARTHLGCFIYQPSATVPDRLDCIVVRGLIGLRRFRRDASMVISQTRVAHVNGAARRALVGEPLDSVCPEHGLSLLSEFCSHPLPTIRRVPTDLECMTNIEIVGAGIGNTSAVTCLIGDIFRGASPRYRDENNRAHISNLRVRTPCEVLVQDVLMHRELSCLGRPRLSVFSDHRDVDVRLESHIEARACDRLTLKESVAYLGRGLDSSATEDVPRYPAILHYAFRRAGWAASEFEVYRCRIEYPVMPSSVVVHFDLPLKPQPTADGPRRA